MIRAELRTATEADIPFVMETERGPGYDALVGRSSEAVHRAALAAPGCATLLALKEGEPAGFLILQQLDDPHGNVYLKRIAVREPGAGFGRAVLVAAQDRVFARPEAHRFHLQVLEGNERAKRAYAAVGFREEGLLRESYRLPDGARVSQHLLSILRPEWERLRGRDR